MERPGQTHIRLPDLIIAWRDEPLLNEAHTDEFGRVSVTFPDLRSGNRRPGGFRIFYGRRIRKQQVFEARLVDVAPTVLQYFGFKPSIDIDGRLLAAVFS